MELDLISKSRMTVAEKVDSIDWEDTDQCRISERNENSEMDFNNHIASIEVRYTDFEEGIASYWNSIGDQNYFVSDKLRCTRVGKLASHHSKQPRKCQYTPLFEHQEKKLRKAANAGRLDNVRKIIETTPGLNVNAGDEKQRTALHFSAAKGADEIVHWLLQCGADPNVKDQSGNSPLHLAACTNHIRVVTLLLHYGGDASALDKAGKTPLHLALSHLELFRKQDGASEFKFDRRKTEVKEIANLLKEFIHQRGSQGDREHVTVIMEKLANSTTNFEVDEVGELLTTFTKMALDSRYAVA